MTRSWSNICCETESTLRRFWTSWSGWPASTTSGSPRPRRKTGAKRWPLARERVLERCLSTVTEKVDHVVIDTAPYLGLLTFNALCAAEHFTGVFGHWALNNSWDDMGVDPTLCDLYRWHAAEEVEHRHVSYNVAKYFGMDYVAQAAAGALVTFALFGMVLRGMKFLVHADPALPNLGYLRLAWKLRESGKLGSLPKAGYVVRAALRLFRRDYNPVNEGNTAQAVAYLAASPAARALHG